MSDVPSDGLGRFVTALPKAELHVHIEGTLEVDTMVALARKNGLLDDLVSAAGCRDAAAFAQQTTLRRQSFEDLGDFLSLYNAASAVLREEDDFAALAAAYVARCRENNVVYAEIFFDPQSHLARGVPTAAVVNGLHGQLEKEREKGGFDGHLIACVLRDWQVSASDDPALSRGTPSAEETLEALRPFVAEGKILALGMDNDELHAVPSAFSAVFRKAREELGLKHAVAHAGEEGAPVPYITEAVESLGVQRVDHGVRCLEDPAVTALLRQRSIPLTVCPTSNLALRVVDRYFKGDPDVLGPLAAAGVTACVNSDDPAYFGGYVSVNYYVSALATPSLTAQGLAKLAEDSFRCAFVSREKAEALAAGVAAAVRTLVGLEDEAAAFAAAEVMVQERSAKGTLPEVILKRLNVGE